MPLSVSKTEARVVVSPPSKRAASVSWASCWLVVSVVLIATDAAIGHPISLTEATVDVHRDRVDVSVQVLVEDLVLYGPVAASGEGVYPANELRAAAERHSTFVLNGLRLLKADGRKLAGELVAVDHSKITDDGVAEADVKQVSVTYSLKFPVDGPLSFLTVSQQFGGEKAILPAMMDCQVRQTGVVLDLPQPLMIGQTLTTRFDWNKPPTPPKNWRELQERRRERLKQQLGIASYSGLYSFLYITPGEVRHEILIPLLTLEEWLPIERADPNVLTVDEQQRLTKAIGKFFAALPPVVINGDEVAAVTSRVSFFGLDIRDFALNAKPRPVSMAQGRVGIILTYACDDVPQTVKARWETFSQYAPFLKSVVYEFDEEPTEHFFRPDSPEFHWTRSELIKVARRTVSPVKVEGVVTERNSGDVAGQLVASIYNAFGLQGEEETYDALATSVDGPFLRTLYLQIRRSLLMAEQGGSKSRVLSVTPVSTRMLGEATATDFNVQHRWRVVGSVEHWGHIHTRENEFDATLSIRQVDGVWKLKDVRFTSQKRVRFETRLRSQAEQ
jgi:hypothetical protein